MEELEEETSKFFYLLLGKTGGTWRAKFRVVYIEDTAAKEVVVQLENFLYHIHILDGSLIVELAKGSLRKFFNTVRLFCYICYVSNIKALFKAYGGPSSDQCNNRASNVEGHLVTCKERM